MLARFREAKKAELEKLRKSVPPPFGGKRPNFAQALQGPQISIIAEYKRASPSLGPIRADLSVEDVACQYETGGAAAMSILTEEKFFAGNEQFLHRAHACSKLPLLRKDFIFDPLQVEGTAATPAAAMLLIVRMLAREELAELRDLAKKHGIAAVVEIFDANDLETARSIGAELIQVNSRDLATLQTNREGPLELIRQFSPRKNELWVAASGMDSPEHLQAAQKAGYSAALMGTALMKAPHPGKALEFLLKNCRNCDVA